MISTESLERSRAHRAERSAVCVNRIEKKCAHTCRTAPRLDTRKTMLFGSAPTLFPAYHCSPSVCADVHATVKSRLEEGDVDGLVRARFAQSDTKLQMQPLTTGSRLLRQVAEVIALTGESDPLSAMGAMLRELKELREIKEKVLECTHQLSVDGAIDVIEVAMRDRSELRTQRRRSGRSSHGRWLARGGGGGRG